jgi:pimeloyl-ACP methyl ester carboxylesterase
MPLAHRIDVDGLPMAYETHGEGPPLLLVAGTGYPGATWLREMVAPLAAHFTVVVFDHRGTGATPATPGPYETRQFAADAAGLLRVLDLAPAHVLGHSMGGRVAQWMALDHPDVVDTLVLAATGPGQFDDAQPVQRGIPVHTAESLIEWGYAGYMREHIAATFFTPDFVASSPQVVERLVEAFWTDRPSLHDYLEHISARQRHQTAERLHEINQPALVLVGDRDTHRGGTGRHSEQSQYLAEHLPHATLHVIPGTAHGYFWQEPEESVRAVVEWLTRD